MKAAPAYSSLIYKTPSPLNGTIDSQFPSFGGNLTLASNHALALPLIPYDFTVYIPASGKTGDIVHRFYHEQLQIDNGLLEDKNGDLDKFVTWSDNPGLVLSYVDATNLPEGKLAQAVHPLRQFLPFGFWWLLFESPMVGRRGDPAMDRGDSSRLSIELRCSEQSSSDTGACVCLAPIAPKGT